ncbi:MULTISPECIES: site-specific DNA-methyltransferase [Campylobacter]|uniref:site-specific DNA-methyltransferase n=1 Tax=Campylobacter TaxID=194 RepID=UPI0023F1207A|nr:MULTISPECIES: site-specific DNA-methyltransferase [Campylobacter]MCI6641061.1 site-specific DNA-methyltransferase [Campylobacter sp.]MDD7422362.1 site-specific DNA-methyltransferase [Campylobacter hominis]MDY3117551.1 site-specific DNA-methyltransferase [Campylobacter hominis]
MTKNEFIKNGAKIFDAAKTQNNELFEILKTKFPQTINDNQVNLTALKTLLNIPKNEIQGYELTWTGKGLANMLYSTSPDTELKFIEKTGKNAENVIIKGDNLEVLKILKNGYYEKVKLIYIDPPYNTDSENFIYPDTFYIDEIVKELKISNEMMNFFKNITGTKSHSGWLSFMLPRLKLARDLLKDDGVIFISIDDNEMANLKILCDEIFGEDNFVACLCVVDNLKGNNNTDGVSQTNEYCLIYAKNREILKINELKIQEDDESLLKWNIDEFGYWKEGRNIKGTGENAPREKRPSMFYPIYLNDNMEISLEKNDEFYIEVLPLTNNKEMCWNWSKEFLKNNKHELIVKKTKNGFNFIKKQRPSLGDLPSKKIKTTCYSPKYSTSVSSNTIKEIFNNESVFNYSKSIYLIKDFLQISTTPNSNDIILDFFAGSGTTAHAVMELNAEDGGNRKFILVQIDEKIDEQKSKTAYDFCKNELKSKIPFISDITVERVKRAAAKIKKEKNTDLGFKIFSIENKVKLQKQKEELNLTVRNISPFDTALNLMLSSGKTLDCDLIEIFKDKLYRYEESFYLVDCDDDVLKFLRQHKECEIFIDGYENLSLQNFLNLNEIFKDKIMVIY